MSILLAHRPRNSTYQRGSIACRKCKAPIYFYKLKALPEEFSVQCSKCRDRGIYLKGAITFQELPERRRKPRK
jgi:hypothetical protein